MAATRSWSTGSRLPVELTSFVGRREEVAQVRRLIAKARLVTLTGVGGCGKTRLALQVAHELRRAYPHGVWLVDLCAVDDGSLLAYRVGEALEIHDRSDRPATETVVTHLRARELLLVLDNCEHLAADCAGFVDRVLRAAPGVRVLCTSRQPLRVSGEHLVTVPPLPVPDPDGPLADDAVARYPGLALFVERAAATEPGFALTAGNRAAVVRICRQLDGLPLAIELAAPRVRALSVDQIEAGLRQHLRLLSVRYATPAHHRTLEATFDWSFALCAPAERELWARLSVFAGSFELAAAEQVCAGGAVPAVEVAQVLAELVDKSVLVSEEHAGGLRFRMLETIRRYGLDRLRAGGDAGGPGEAELRRRHLDWYLDLAERFAVDWFGQRQREWTRRMCAEQDNLRAALGHSLANAGLGPAGLRLAGALTSYWWVSGAVHEGHHWLDRALATGGPPGPARQRALLGCCWLLQVRGDHRTAEDLARECLDQQPPDGDAVLAARAICALGLSHVMADDLAAARPLLERAVAMVAPLPDAVECEVMAKLCLATAVHFQSEHRRAVELLEECAAICRLHGEQYWLGAVLAVTTMAALALGDLPLARRSGTESLRLHRGLNDPIGAAGSVERLAWLAVAERDLPRGARLFGAADRMWHDVGAVLYSGRPWLRQRETWVSTAREVLGDAKFQAEYRRGRGIDIDDAVAYALGDGSPAAQRHARIPARRTVVLSHERGTELTAREWEVAELVADGMSNKEIAAALVTSRRTAESHVENILRKLGFTTRTQVAVWVAQRGGPADHDGG